MQRGGADLLGACARELNTASRREMCSGKGSTSHPAR